MNNTNTETLMAKLRAIAASRYPGAQDALERLISDLERGGDDSDRRDAQAYRDYRKKRDGYIRGRDDILGGWNREEKRIRESVPEFSLDEMLRSPEFREMLAKGMGPEGAYYALKYNELKNSGASAQQKRRPINQNAGDGSASSGGYNDIMAMSDKDFMKSIRRMMNK